MFKYALDLVLRRKTRTFLTSLGITIAVMLMTFILFGMTDLKTALLSEFSSRFNPQDLYVSGQDNMSFGGMVSAPTKNTDIKEDKVLTEEIREEIEQIEGVKSAEPLLYISGLEMYLEGDETAYPLNIVGGADLPGTHHLYKTFYGENENLGDYEIFVSDYVVSFFETTNEEIIGKKILAKSSFSTTLLALPSKSMFDKEYEFTITGVVGSTSDAFWINTNTSLDILTDLGGYTNHNDYIQNIGYPQLLVDTQEGSTEEVERTISDDLGLFVISSDTVLSFVDTLTSALTFALIFFGLISALVASIGIINTMVMSIYEQTKEIGIIKAMGASNIQVLVIFLIQSALIGLIGGVIGLTITFAMMKLADPFVVQVLNDQGLSVSTFFNFQPLNALYITLGSIFVGILAGLYPARKAASLDPVKALRYE